MRRAILACALVAILPAMPLADTHLVQPDGTGDYLTIQDAIYLAAPGDTVELGNGTFTGDGNRDIVIPAWAIIVVRSQSGCPDSCTIDCEGSDSNRHFGFVFEAPSASVPSGAALFLLSDPVRPPWFRDEDEPMPILEGVTIRNGYAEKGGAILVRYGAPIIRNNILVENTSTWGGGIHVEFANPVIRDNVIESNEAVDGGGIYAFQASPLIEYNVIANNRFAERGGGIYREQGVRGEIPSVIRSNQIHHNVPCDTCDSTKGGGIFITRVNSVIYANDIDSCQAFSGAGIYVIQANPDLVDNVITSNAADDKGGGVYLHTCHPLLLNNLIAHNEADVMGGGIHNWISTPYLVKNTIAENHPSGLHVSREDNEGCAPSHPTLDSVILWHNGTDIYINNGAGITLSYSDVEDYEWEGVGNESCDPGFDDGFCIDPDSCCVDAGNPDFPSDPDESRTDMGWICRADDFDWTWEEIDSVRVDPDPLMLLMREIQYYMPGAGSFGYVPPDSAALAVWRQAITYLEDGDAVSCSTLVDQFGYDLANDAYFGTELYILKERYPIQRGWGTYIYNMSPAGPNIQCHVNHPVYDYDSYKMGLDAFREYEARWFLMAGTHRYANCEFEPPDDDCESDMARAENSVFQTVYETAANLQTTALSFHTFSAADHEVDFWIALSLGSREYGSVESVVCVDGGAPACLRLEQIYARIEDQLGDGRCCVAPRDTSQCDNLGAARNRQGVFTNASLTEGNWVSIECATNVAAMDSVYALVIEAVVTSDTEQPTQTLAVQPVLQQCTPNPFGHYTDIRFAAETQGPVRLNIYDVNGRHVRGLTGKVSKRKGWQTVRWDGRDNNGTVVSSGVYLCRLDVGNETHTRLFTRIR